MPEDPNFFETKLNYWYSRTKLKTFIVRAIKLSENIKRGCEGGSPSHRRVGCGGNAPRRRKQCGLDPEALALGDFSNFSIKVTHF